MNKILLSALISTSFLSLTTFAATPPETSIQAQKQVAGYYQYQAGDVQITALLDGTNFMSPSLFKDIPQQQVHEILKNTMQIKIKAYKLQSMPSSSIQENLWF